MPRESSAGSGSRSRTARSGPDAPDHAPAIHDERYRIHGAMCELLAALAATKPIVLVLDDVHWADAASIELLGGLLRRPPPAAVLLALALRPRQIPPRLSAALDRAHRDGSLTRIELGALSRDEASELTGEAALYDEGGGNPFYLLELARSPGPRTQRRAGLAGIDVPPMVLAALDEELALLSPTARRELEGAAVAGDPFDPELAAAAADSGLPETIDALDELLRLGLVRETDVPRRFRFRHPIVRRAVYERSAGGWRLGAHERCAAALAARGAPSSARAHHVERSARQGDAAAVATLREAGDSAAALAPASAANWYGGALRLLPEHAPAQERIGLLLARGDMLVSAGEYLDGRAALLEALAMVADDAVALRVALTTRCAAAEQLLGRHEQAHARLRGALDALPRGASRESVALMAHLAYDGFFRMQFEPMLDWAARGVADARALASRPLTAATLSLLALAQACAGPIPDAERHRGEAASIIDALDDAELPLYLEAFPVLAGAELYLDRFEAAAAHAERGLTVARGSGAGQTIATLPRILGRACVCRGALFEAAAVLDGAVEAARLSGSAQELAWVLLNRCFAATAAGDLETALAAGEEAVQLTRDSTAASCRPGRASSTRARSPPPMSRAGPSTCWCPPGAVTSCPGSRRLAHERPRAAHALPAGARPAGGCGRRGRRGNRLRRPVRAAPRRAGAGASRRRRRRRNRDRDADRARAPDRPAGGRPPDQHRDRRRAVPQPQDDRGPPAQHLREARRLLARRGRPRGRTGAPGRGYALRVLPR